MSDVISIQFTRFSAFYSPLIATMAGGFLKQEGLEGKHSVSPPGKSAIAGLLDGSVHVAQSAPSQGFAPLEQGKQPPALHFAQINEKDGFFLVGRNAEPQFNWQRLAGRRCWSITARSRWRCSDTHASSALWSSSRCRPSMPVRRRK